jgi:FlaA1/EpsC-like NDP-sugar epimerase
MTKLNFGEDGKFFEAVVGRSEIKMLSDENLQSHYGDSRILIIGAGGSIGSAISRRLEAAQISDLFS